jgi:hypothetical protein
VTKVLSPFFVTFSISKIKHDTSANQVAPSSIEDWRQSGDVLVGSVNTNVDAKAYRKAQFGPIKCQDTRHVKGLVELDVYIDLRAVRQQFDKKTGVLSATFDPSLRLPTNEGKSRTGLYTRVHSDKVEMSGGDGKCSDAAHMIPGVEDRSPKLNFAAEEYARNLATTTECLDLAYGANNPSLGIERANLSASIEAALKISAESDASRRGRITSVDLDWASPVDTSWGDTKLNDFVTTMKAENGWKFQAVQPNNCILSPDFRVVDQEGQVMTPTTTPSIPTTTIFGDL